MANLRMTLLDLLNKDEQGADPSFLRDGVRLLAQELMDVEATQLAGAGLHERSENRLTYRNGYREREWDTRVGTVDLQIPKLRQGAYFPSLLEPRRRHERALLAVVQEAYVHGVSTRAVDNLAEALGLKGISKDQVSRICKELDGQVTAFRTRALDSEHPYLMLDATFEKVRENGRVISMAVLITTGVKVTGEREVVGVDVGPAEDLEFWRAFLRQLVSRGLSGVRLVTSDSHLGLKQAVAEILVGATWQRCRVHFMRNALATVPKLAQQMVAATLRTIFAQPDADSAHDTVERVCRLFEKRYPQLVACLRDAETDVLAYYDFPFEHRRQIWSTNSLERLNREVGRRCEVVGIFPNRPALLRLAGAVLEEQNDVRVQLPLDSGSGARHDVPALLGVAFHLRALPETD
ncbi:MAG: IS256 family transposase, partial [Candidatus Dormibacteraeota bacterium]|nr:IS256 family transposase [Candidatus Dormibacteraeota bacterium]